MFQHVPKTEAELMMISGVGEVKLERHGREFLAVDSHIIPAQVF
jgi:superfamily II DNA helicase RecQ